MSMSSCSRSIYVAPYGAFVGQLRDALRERLPEAQVSVSTQANEVGAAMAAAAAAAGADRVFLMGYDYHWTGSSAGGIRPDRPARRGRRRTCVWSLDLYEALGVPLDRTLLGLPLYGITWPVDGTGARCPEHGARRGLGAALQPRRS